MIVLSRLIANIKYRKTLRKVDRLYQILERDYWLVVIEEPYSDTGDTFRIIERLMSIDYLHRALVKDSLLMGAVS